MIRRRAIAGALCAATGLAAPAAAGADPATCQAIKPVVDEIVAVGAATDKAFDPNTRPSPSPGYNPLKEIADHYRRAGAAASAAAQKVSDPDVAGLLQRMSAAFDALASKRGSDEPAQKLSVDKGDGEAFASLERACGYLSDH